MSKFAEKEELAHTLQQVDKKNLKLEHEIAQLQTQFRGLGRTNKELEEKIDYIYERQREVTIGKRNINCLSCSEEPENRAMPGTDGKVYRGKSPEKRAEDKMMERTRSRGSSEGKKSKTKQLLNMKWDNIGLQQTQYSNTFNLHKLQSEERRAYVTAGIKSDHASQLFEVLTEEDNLGQKDDEGNVVFGDEQDNSNYQRIEENPV